MINELAIAEDMTKDNDVITVNYCVNYGGRAEIAEATKEIARLAAAGRLNPERITESTVANHLQRPDIPDVDLFLRTSGSSGPAISCCGRRHTPSTSSGQIVARLRPSRPVGRLRGIRLAQPPIRERIVPSLQERLASILRDVLALQEETDGALTVHHDGTIASLRVVNIAEGLDLVSLTQILAWDLPLTKKLSDQVAKQARDSNFGSVSLIEKVNDKAVQRNSGKGAAKNADVMLRYNFPGAGLTDDALRTLILLVLDTGAQVRRTLTA